MTKAIVDSGKALFTNVEALVSLLILAEGCGMDKLPAHCELFMIKLQDKNFQWQHPALMSDRISRHCLLRLLRGAQHHMVNSEARIADLRAQVSDQPATVTQGSLGFGDPRPASNPFGFGAYNQVNDISREEIRHISINTLMEWAKTA